MSFPSHISNRLSIFIVLVIWCVTNSFAQGDSISIHSKNLGLIKAPSSSNRQSWKFTFWEEDQRLFYFYSNGLLIKKCTFSLFYNDTSEKTIYTYNQDGYLLKNEYYGMQNSKLRLNNYIIYERSSDKKEMTQKHYAHFPSFDSIILYEITQFKYDNRSEIIYTKTENFWTSDSLYHISNYHTENRVYLNSKSTKLSERTDSTYNSYKKIVEPTNRNILLYDNKERVKIILMYKYENNNWVYKNKDSLIYKLNETDPIEYHRIYNDTVPNEYLKEMKWNNYQAHKILERAYDLSYFQYDLYSYIFIGNTSNGSDTVTKRVGSKNATTKSMLYYEYRNDRNWNLKLNHKFVEYFDELNNSQMYYYRNYDSLNKNWFGMSGSYHLNEYNLDNTIKTKYAGQLLGDSFIYFYYKFDYFDYVDVLAGFSTENKKEITIYPNPFNNAITINSDGKEIQSVEISNTLGQIVYTEQSIQDQTLDLNDLQKGLYYIRVMIEDQLYSYKIIK